MMRDVTLVLPVRFGRILLGMKKRGFGNGKINGFGGKLNEGEVLVEAAVRELKEEVGIRCLIASLTKVAELEFRFPYREDDSWDQRVHVFLTKNWIGRPKESEEMSPGWYDLDKIPTEKMWDADKIWMKEVLNGKKIFGEFSYGKENEIISHEIFEV